ncbi:hypothetical protein K4A83_21870 [Spirulina subsalsa FACHB-351]|uniref:DUF1795 domain-containing protein n=1 Tax=Spirulina subsalsa FACHB-351 TaxID=234711 RepID=A0ABT3LBJ6_9CYAN|nr:hypothetical protein [Spirulina subsalsa]MCW6038888.1 hypothetical protein [Spirulina subsalsa FACHB-351]
MKKEFLVVLMLIGGLVGCQPVPPGATKVVAPSPDAPVAKRLRVSVNQDFAEIQSRSIRLFLPPSYEGGNPEDDLETVASQLEGAGAKYRDLSQALRESQQIVHLLAFDTAESTQGFVTTVNVTAPTTLPGTTIEKLTDAVVENFRRLDYEVTEQELQLINERLVGRIVVQIRTRTKEITQLVYTLEENDRFWIVTYSTPRNEFRERFSDFEQSIASFQVLDHDQQ